MRSERMLRILRACQGDHEKAALAAEGVTDMGGPAAVPDGEEEEDGEDGGEDYVPRSPVPLPDVATCKPILVQLGFSSLSSAEKTKKKKGEQKCYITY